MGECLGFYMLVSALMLLVLTLPLSHTCANTYRVAGFTTPDLELLAPGPKVWLQAVRHCGMVDCVSCDIHTYPIRLF